MEQLTIAEVKSALPDKAKKNLTNSVMQKINEVLGDPEVYETYRENLLGYSHVLQQGKFKMVNYVDAVKYVSYKLMGKTSKDAFRLVFPDKLRKWDQDGVESKDQASYITAYNNSKLATLIFEQTMIPVHVLNRDNYQRAINVQVELMMTAKSEMVRTTAANSIMTQLKPPVATQVDINLNTTTDSAIDALTASTQAMIDQQKMLMRAGAISAQDVAHQQLVVIDDGEFSEVTEVSVPEPEPEPEPEKVPATGLFG